MKVLKDLAVSGQITVGQLLQSSIDTDKFIVSDGGVAKFRTGSQLLGDIDGVINTRTITINGTAQDLTANRSFTVGDVRTDGSYANPAWITSLAWSKITGAPAFLTAEADTLATVTGRGATTTSSITAGGFVKSGGTSSQFLKADGSVDSNTYLTSVSDVWVNNSGDSMTGNLSFGSSGAGITWAANTDGASITFESTGDGASGGRALSNLLIALSDNGDEGLKVTSAGTEFFYVNTNQIQYKGNTIWHSANDGSGSGLDADLLDGINSGSFLRSDVIGASVSGTIISTNNANVDGPNFDVNTTNKTVNEYAYRVSRSGSAVGGILIDGRGSFASGTTVNGSTVWHQGNLTNLNQLTNGPGYITSYTESDTLSSVTGRGASTNTFVSLLGGSRIVVQNSTDGGNNRGIFMWNTSDTNWGIYMSTAGASKSLANGTAPTGIDGSNSHHIRFRIAGSSGNGFIWENHSEQTLMSVRGDNGNLYVRGQIYAGNSTTNQVWHSGNLTNLNQLTNGPGYITGYTETDTLASVTGRGSSTSTNLTFNGTLTMGTGGTQYIRMGRFPASLSNTGEAWIGRASDRSAGTMTVQLGGSSNSSFFEIVDHAWSTVTLKVGMNDFSYKGNTIYHAGNLTNLNQLTNGPGYITSYTETDTFQSVVSRGSSASTGSVQGVTITHTYNQTNLHHNTLWLKANNSGANLGASIGFTVVNAAGDHHRANILVTGNTGNVGGQFAIYTRSTGGTDVRGYYQNEAGNIRFDNYIGVGQDPNTSYRIIADGSLYLNSNGNGWAEGVWKQRRGGGTFYDVIDAGNIGSQSVSYAASAGSLSNVNISQFTNNSGYITSTNTDFTYSASLTLSTSWQNTGVTATQLSTSGVYIVTCALNDFAVSGGQYSETYVGLMYWYASGTNSNNAAEIPLHHSGHADNDRYIYLRTLTDTGAATGKIYLQIKGNGNNSGASTYSFTFKRLL
jgi:hypothetical protein